MAAISPGDISRAVRKTKKPTQTTKAHRFEPFNKRVAKLKIDPIHTVQKSNIVEKEQDITKSYFRTNLDKHAELNLSQNFTSFRGKVSSLSESLPQILHHTDVIVNILLEHIENGDQLSLEPLLDLISHLARDLGGLFEQYFEKTIKLVLRIASTQENPEVIEWSFTCLAWLLKYLSRLLVQDLRPLLEVMMPYLSHRKEHIRRFTAESLAFLIRKATVMFKKQRKPLVDALQYLFEQLVSTPDPDEDAYSQSMMTLLAQSVQGVDAQLHSSASDLLNCVFDLLDVTKQSYSRIMKVIQGTVTNLIHANDAQGFRPMLTEILRQGKLKTQEYSTRSLLSTRMLLVVIGTRKGTRIENWSNVFEVLLLKTKSIPYIRAEDLQQSDDLFLAIALSLQNSPMPDLLPVLNDLVTAVATNLSPRRFFAFCDTVSNTGQERFQDLLLPHLQQYVTSHWIGNESAVGLVSHDLLLAGSISNDSSKKDLVKDTSQMDNVIVDQILSAFNQQELRLEYLAYFGLGRWLKIPRNSIAGETMTESLWNCLKSTLEVSEGFDALQQLKLGWGFQWVLAATNDCKLDYRDIWNLIVSQSRDRFQLTPFIDGCTIIANMLKRQNFVAENVNHLYDKVLPNLFSGSKDMKIASIRFLKAVSESQNLTSLHEVYDELLEVLETTYCVSNNRKLSMLMRRLPQYHSEILGAEPSLERLVPYFLFGILPNYHESLRQDVCSALASISLKSNGEDIVMAVVEQWLRCPGVVSHSPSEDQEQTMIKTGDFQCSQFSSAERIWLSRLSRFVRPEEVLRQIFDTDHELQPQSNPVESRTLALQLMLLLPDTAARRSRIWTPAFLSSQQGKINDHIPASNESTSSYTLTPELDERPWSLKDRKLFLQLLGTFTNPKVLYRADEVKLSLLEGLTNGNSEVRKLCLEAVLTWKDGTLLKYKEVLTKIAEDKNGTNELLQMLSSEDEDASIKPQDRFSVMPIVLRIIFGQLVGRSGTHGSQEAKRKTILRLLFRMNEADVLMFLDIAKGRLREASVVDYSANDSSFLETDLVNLDQQYGFLRMVLSMFEILESQLHAYGAHLVDTVLYCTTRSSYQLNKLNLTESGSSLLRNVRKTGLQCLLKLTEHCHDLPWGDYISLIFDQLVTPRLSNFAEENAQGVSVLLKLFSAWAGSANLAHMLHEYDQHLMPALWETLEITSSKNEVRVFIIESIIQSLSETVNANLPVLQSTAIVLRTESENILSCFLKLLQSSPARAVVLAIISALPALTPFSTSTASVSHLLDSFILILNDKSYKLPPHQKGQIFKAVKGLLEISQVTINAETRDNLIKVVAKSFDYFKDEPNRQLLVDLFKTLAINDEILMASARLCESLNAVSENILDGTDFDARIAALNVVGELSLQSSSAQELLPLLCNLLFFARTSEDFGIRSNAVSSLRNFISKVCQLHEPDMRLLVGQVLLPGLYRGIKEDAEMVRADFVALFGVFVRYSDLQEYESMKVLLVGNDEEASFFTNILHIQTHRRVRAINRLIAETEAGNLTSDNIVSFFIPLLQKFISDQSNDDSQHSVKGNSVSAYAKLLRWLDWSSFRKLLRQLNQDIQNPLQVPSTAIKILGYAVEAIQYARAQRNTEEVESNKVCYLAQGLPTQDVTAEEFRLKFVPKLMEISHYKEEAEISERIPAAVVAMKMVRLLPEDQQSQYAAPILLDISQILRSRAQESRDFARKTLADIVQLMGPSSMRFVLDALRSALTRGYQLHVLSYTLHTILLAVIPETELGSLDYCLNGLVRVIMDDIFGVVGQEKANQDYVSSMKEVKSSKSFDSMELLATTVSVTQITKLIDPIETITSGALTAKQSRQVDELLRRIGVGISHNPTAGTQDILIFCYQLIENFYNRRLHAKKGDVRDRGKDEERYLVQLESKRQTTVPTVNSTSFKIVKFAIDLVRSSFARYPTLLTPANVHGFIPIIGDSLLQGEEDVKISSLRLLSSIVKLPMLELTENSSVYITEAIKIVKNAHSTNEEAAQAALKLLTSFLRDRKEVEVRESDLAYLIHRTMPDLEEPDRQGVTFNFIKAVMARRFHLPEVYELADKIGGMMVTSQSRNSRESARGMFVHFLLDYPQSKSRWSKQVKFMVKNLDYQYPEGRQSLMEAIHILLNKLDAEPAQELVSTIFVPVILRMANDDNSSCRELAGGLLSQLYKKVDEARLATLLDLLTSWTEQSANLSIVKVAYQAWNLYFAAGLAEAESHIPLIRSSIFKTLQSRTIDGGEELVQYHALNLMLTLAEKYPTHLLTAKQGQLWAEVRSSVWSNDVWVQFVTVDLIGAFFRDCAMAGCISIPLRGKYGLSFDTKATTELFQMFIRVLKQTQINEELANKTILNILFLARCAENSDVVIQIRRKDIDDAQESDEAEDDMEGDTLNGNITAKASIRAIQYLFDQCTSILRREPRRLNAEALKPKLNTLSMISQLLPHISTESFSEQTIQALLMPLLYLTDPNNRTPRSSDSKFADSYANLITSAHETLEALQTKLGDAAYVRNVTAASKAAKMRREERRAKRRIERVAEPEKSARDKRRKSEKNKERRKEIKGIYRSKRRADLGF